MMRLLSVSELLDQLPMVSSWIFMIFWLVSKWRRVVINCPISWVGVCWSPQKSLSYPGVLHVGRHGRGATGTVVAGVDALEVLLVLGVKGHDLQLSSGVPPWLTLPLRSTFTGVALLVSTGRATAGGAQRIAFLCDQGTIAVYVEGTVTRVDRIAGAVYGKEAWAIEREIVVIAGGHQCALLKSM